MKMKINNEKKEQQNNWNAKLKTHKWEIIFAVFVLIILVFSALTMQGTFGRFMQIETASDSAFAAEFDVVITPPSDFVWQQGASVLDHTFITADETGEYIFQATNYSETDIVCRPYVTNGVSYGVYVDGRNCNEFTVSAGRSVFFTLVISAGGIGADVTEASFCVDIEQAGGSVV
jgi:hypothetical protein